MDVHHLERIDDNGLELWKPVMRSVLPITGRLPGGARRAWCAGAARGQLVRSGRDVGRGAAWLGRGLRLGQSVRRDVPGSPPACSFWSGGAPRTRRRLVRAAPHGARRAALNLSGRGCDVEVHAEQVRRVVLGLELCEPVVVDAVPGADQRVVLLAEPGEVEVDPAGGVLLQRGPELASPGDRLDGDSRSWP
jgi:hypothetical protein